jgi:hypothetical protein
MTTITPESLQRAVAAARDALGLDAKAELPTRTYDALVAGWHELLAAQPAPVAAAPQAVDLAEVERAMLYHVGKHATAYVMAELRALNSQQKESSDAQ